MQTNIHGWKWSSRTSVGGYDIIDRILASVSGAFTFFWWRRAVL